MTAARPSAGGQRAKAAAELTSRCGVVRYPSASQRQSPVRVACKAKWPAEPGAPAVVSAYYIGRWSKYAAALLGFVNVLRGCEGGCNRARYQIDGVGFGDAGLVFIDEEDIARELGTALVNVPRTDNDFRYSYRGGTRIALGEALVARICVAFSEEEKDLVYLVFGLTF